MYVRYVLILALLLSACTDRSKRDEVSLDELPTFNETSDLYAVIEIPAGTNHKIEYNKYNGEFEVNIKNGMPRVVEFLPYPGNYGFIPSTFMDPEHGGDGDALDILVLAESVPTGTVMNTIPIAVLELLDGGEIDNKIIAVPSDHGLRIIPVDSYDELLSDHSEVVKMIEQWFLNYKGNDKMQFVAWKGQEEAFKEIEKWQEKLE